MSQSLLAEALAAGASIVTPNNRLAREVARVSTPHDTRRAARAWTPAQALPWTLWLRSAVACGTRFSAHRAGRVLLDASATRELWHLSSPHDRRELLNRARRRTARRRRLDAISRLAPPR